VSGQQFNRSSWNFAWLSILTLWILQMATFWLNATNFCTMNHTDPLNCTHSLKIKFLRTRDGGLPPFLSSAQQQLRWATIWPQYTWRSIELLPRHSNLTVLTWRPFAIVHFQTFKILTTDRLKWSKCIIVPNITAICPTVAELWWFNSFSKWRPSAILDLLCACLDNWQ